MWTVSSPRCGSPRSSPSSDWSPHCSRRGRRRRRHRLRSRRPTLRRRSRESRPDEKDRADRCERSARVSSAGNGQISSRSRKTMKWDDVYISASAAHLGSVVEDVRDAVAEGRYDAEEYAVDGYEHVRVAPDGESPADMAVAAAQLAMSRSDVDRSNVVTVVHGGIGGQGLYYWPAASYIQENTVGGSAYSFEVKQNSNSGMAALEIAAAYLLTKPTPCAALVTTA